MFNAEITKGIKKPPVVEFDIPKKIFYTNREAQGKSEELVAVEENTLLSLWSFE